LISAVLGFGVMVGTAATLAKILFQLFLFVAWLFMDLRKWSPMHRPTLAKTLERASCAYVWRSFKNGAEILVYNVLATWGNFRLRLWLMRTIYRTAMSDACTLIPSLENLPASMAVGSRQPKSDVRFNTITGCDWKRSLVSARQRRASASERIRTMTSSSGNPKK